MPALKLTPHKRVVPWRKSTAIRDGLLKKKIENIPFHWSKFILKGEKKLNMGLKREPWRWINGKKGSIMKKGKMSWRCWLLWMVWMLWSPLFFLSFLLIKGNENPSFFCPFCWSKAMKTHLKPTEVASKSANLCFLILFSVIAITNQSSTVAHVDPTRSLGGQIIMLTIHLYS